MLKINSAIFALSVAVTGGAVNASEVNDPIVSSCTGINCNSIDVTGQVMRSNLNGNWRARPYNIQLFAGPNECFRVETIFQAQDLELTVITPDGTVYRDDDGSSLCSVCSLVKFVTPASQRGWYTVHVSHWAGAAVDAEFRLLYGRYNSTNPNCSGPTSPAMRSSMKSQ